MTEIPAPSPDGDAPPDAAANPAARPRRAKPASAKLPKLVICAGLPRSGSTWIYNAVLMLLRSRGSAVGVFSETISDGLGEHAGDDVSVVVKCHAPDHALVTLARMMNAPVILSVRDPRDCLVSLETAFAVSRATAVEQLSNSGSALLALHDGSRALIVKYEDSGDRAKVIRSLAGHLGVEADETLVRTIADGLSLDVMREKIARWEAEGALDADHAAEVWTEESHWHAHHVGDGRTGKYIEQLSAQEAAAVSSRMTTFFSAFGYEPDIPPPIKSGATVRFGSEGVAYAAEGFGIAEDWGAWTVQPEARVVLPLTKPARRIQLELSLMRGPCFGPGRDGCTARLSVNRKKVADLFADAQQPGDMLLVYDGPAGAVQEVEVGFDFKGLVSPSDLGLGEDGRLLGVGLRTIRITYK